MNIFGEEHLSLWAIETDEKFGKSTVAIIVTEGTEGASEFKPLKHKGKLHDDVGYYVSCDGRILSIKRKNGKPLIISPKRSQNLDKSDSINYMKPPAVNLSVPIGYYEDYEYTLNTTGVSFMKPNVRFHRVAIETWKPFEQWCHEADPPIDLEVWKNAHPQLKEFILESYYVDHIDADTSNSHVDNLRYCTPIRNSNYRKEKSGEFK